jgi:hypothetical protein
MAQYGEGGQGTVQQSVRIGAALASRGFMADLILDTSHEPVAVRVRGVFTSDEGQVILQEVSERASGRGENEELGGVLPYGKRSGQVYPRSVCDAVDGAVQGALERDDVLATRVYSSETGHVVGVGDASPHTDFPGNLDNPPAEAIHGMNVHVTLAGEGEARFGLIRSFAAVRTIADAIHNAKRAGRDVLEINATFAALYGEHMASASPPVAHGAGDILIFQSRPHERRGLLPVVHHFLTTNGDRSFIVFVPKCDSRERVSAARDVLIEHEGLARLGYVRSTLRTGSSDACRDAVSGRRRALWSCVQASEPATSGRPG